MYLGSWDINDYITFYINTHNTSTGAASDADSAPTYRIYEDETGTAIVTGSMSLLDDSNTTGFYSERIQLLSSTGYEKGKSYVIYISATVNSITGTTNHTFQIQANVDSKTVSDKTGYSITGTVTVGTNNDKTGYTVSTVQDKTGYSLSVTPPTASDIWSNATRTLTSSGAVTVAVNNDKTGYSLSGGVTVTTNNDKTGYILATTPPTAQNIWEYTNRTLTSSGDVYISVASDQIASAVWNAQTSHYTSTGSMGKALTSTGTAVIDASDVWNYHTRTLTSTGDATIANQEIIINHLTDIKGDGWSDETLVSIQEGVNNGIWGGYGE